MPTAPQLGHAGGIAVTMPWAPGYLTDGQNGRRSAQPSSGPSIQAAVATVSEELAGQLPDGAPGPEVMRLITGTVRRWAQNGHATGGAAVPPSVQDAIAAAVYHQRYGLGRFDAYLTDQAGGQVENVDFIGYDQVWVTYATGERAQVGSVFGSDAELIDAVRLLASRGGRTARDFTEQNPLVNVAVGTHVRLTASMDVTPRPCVSLRRHGHVSIGLAQLTELGTVDQVLAQFLAAAVKARLNIIISGAANAGKTTLLRALASEIPAGEQVATIETDRELFLEMAGHFNVIPFEQRLPNSEGTGGVTLMTMLAQALRHHTTRIVVGEARTDEVVPMLEAMNSGWAGSMCTLHANSADAVFDRVLILSLRGGLALPDRAIHMLTGNAVDLIVHIRQHHDGHRTVRRVSEVLEVMPPGDSEQPSSTTIFAAAGPAEYATPRNTPSSGLLRRLEEAGFDPRRLNTLAAAAPRGWQ